jgi:two-component system response regulator FlrC
LLLDEVTEMPLALQAKLLRVLQERELERVGGKHTIRLDIRVIATSNRDLRLAVADGHLREDLYYRLQVFPLEIPPLRERQADILPLSETLLRRHCQQLGFPLKEFSVAAKQQLYFYDWPGNVRELDNALNRAVILANGTDIQVEDLCLSVVSDSSGTVLPDLQKTEMNVPDNLGEGLALDDLRAHHEREAIAQALRQSQGSRAEAAERLGISPRTLRHKIQRFREAGYEFG